MAELPALSPAAPSQRLPPSDMEAEQAVLGCVLIRQHVTDVAAILKAGDFFFPVHREIFEAMLAIDKTGVPVDVVTLVDALRAAGMIQRMDGGESYLLALSNSVPTADSAPHYARIVRRAAVARRLIAACAETTARAYASEDVEEVLADHRDHVGRLEATSEGQPVLVGAVIDDVLGVIEDKGMHPDRHFIRTGIAEFDDKIGGTQAEQLIVVASNAGKGKSSLTLGWAIESSKVGVHNLYVQLEMSRQEMVERAIGYDERIDTRHVHLGRLGGPEWIRALRAGKTFREMPLSIVEDNLGLGQIVTVARAWKSRLPPGALARVTVDYLQIIKREHKRGQNEAEAIGEMTRELKLLAKKLKCPVVLVSQLNRENTKDSINGVPRQPELRDLRGSGSIEQDADMVVFPWWVDEEGSTEWVHGPTRAELLVRKHRGGATGAIKVDWDRRFTRFEDVRQVDMATIEDTRLPRERDDA